VNNLYKLDVEVCVALSTKAEKVQSHDVGELWHKSLGYLHHGALKIMQQITTGLPRGALEQHDTCKGCTLGKYTKTTFHDQVAEHMQSLEGSTLVFVDLSRQPPLPGTSILLSLLMTIHGSVGSSSCRRRMRLSPSS